MKALEEEEKEKVVIKLTRKRESKEKYKLDDIGGIE